LAVFWNYIVVVYPFLKKAAVDPSGEAETIFAVGAAHGQAFDVAPRALFLFV
jgi:hypothetical protein